MWMEIAKGRWASKGEWKKPNLDENLIKYGCKKSNVDAKSETWMKRPNEVER